jgi:hypothetical protein
MAAPIEIIPFEGMDDAFLERLRTWAEEVVERAAPLPGRRHILIRVWESVHDLQAFYQKEKEELGVVTGEETEFLATHEAWRGYPRVHICQERIEGIHETVVRGVLHHEIGHTILHGSPEYYTFWFTDRLQEAGRSHGLDLQGLQQLVYVLSIAVKDWDVVGWLTKERLGSGQQALLEYCMAETGEEQAAWEMVKAIPIALRMALAVFLKIILPIEAMVSAGYEGARDLMVRWEDAYGWLPEKERQRLLRLCQGIMHLESKKFQDRLEEAAHRLLSQP